MAELKREYVVPLRRKIRTAPKWRRSKKAVAVLKDFMRQHMSTEDVIVCNELNEYIWENGSKNPPGKVSVVALKTPVDGKDKVLVNLLSVGVDKQKALYEKEIPAETQKQEGVQEAEVTKEEEKQPTKEESKEEETPKEDTSKEEDSKKGGVKKNE